MGKIIKCILLGAISCTIIVLFISLFYTLIKRIPFTDGLKQLSIWSCGLLSAIRAAHIYWNNTKT